MGGSALVLLGIIDRPTREWTYSTPIFRRRSPTLRAPSRSRCAGAVSSSQIPGSTMVPSSLSRVLPDGWRHRTQPAFSGRVLVLETLGRTDLLKTKLFALCDRGTDLADCMAFSPTAEELDEALPWVALQDANELWPAHVEILDLRRRLGHDV